MNIPVNYSDLKISIVILFTLVFFYVYYYFAHSETIRKRFDKHSNINFEVKLFISRKLLGFTVLGLIPGLLYFFLLNPNISIADFFIGNSFSGIYVTLFLAGIIILLTYINQKSKPQRNSLQMNISEWTPSLFAVNAIGWIIYLLAYEFLFRGILLFECYENFGFWPAIAINVAIYSAIHMINSKEEAIGALLFGTIACYFTLQQGTIFIPIIMHIALSLSSDFFSIRINKDLKFIKS